MNESAGLITKFAVGLVGSGLNQPVPSGVFGSMKVDMSVRTLKVSVPVPDDVKSLYSIWSHRLQ